MEVSRPGLVSRPDFNYVQYGSRSRSRISKVSVSKFKGLGLARDYSIETTRPANKLKNVCIPSEKIMFFCVDKYSTIYWVSVSVSDFNGLSLGRGGLGLKWSGTQVGLGLR